MGIIDEDKDSLMLKGRRKTEGIKKYKFECPTGGAPIF